MPKTGLKGMRSTEGRTGKRVAPGRQSLASAHDGGAGSRSKSSGLGSKKAIIRAYHGRVPKNNPQRAPKL